MGQESFWALFYGSISLIPIIGAVFLFRIWLKLKRMTPAVISRVKGEVALIRGRVVLEDEAKEIKSPISGEKCAFYLVQTRSRAQKRIGSPIAHRVHSQISLVVEDATGRAQVNPDGADFILVKDVTFTHGFMAGKFPEKVKEVLDESGIERKVLGLEMDLHCDEIFVKPGEELYVLGYGTRLNDRVFFFKKRGYPFIISDMPLTEIGNKYLKRWVFTLVWGIIILGYAAKIYFG